MLKVEKKDIAKIIGTYPEWVSRFISPQKTRVNTDVRKKLLEYASDMIVLENLAKEKLTLIPPKKIEKLKRILKEKINGDEVEKLIKYPHLAGEEFENIDSLMMYLLIKQAKGEKNGI